MFTLKGARFYTYNSTRIKTYVNKIVNSVILLLHVERVAWDPQIHHVPPYIDDIKICERPELLGDGFNSVSFDFKSLKGLSRAGHYPVE